MTDLVAFLLARIAEDEQSCHNEKTLRHGDPYWASDEQTDFELRLTPDRVLAECEAKRRIMGDHPLSSDVVPVHSGPQPGVGCETCHRVVVSSIDEVDYVEALGPCDTLLALALPYASHADYRAEWRL